MESNPALGLLGFWMMMQLIATLALLIGGIYLMFCLGRAASGLDRMANAMEDWIALQTAQSSRVLPQTPPSAFGQSTPSAPIPAAPPPIVPFTPVSTPNQPQREYSAPDESVH